MDPNLQNSSENTPNEDKLAKIIDADTKIQRHHRPILTSDVDDLYTSRDRLRDFADDIGYLRNTGIRRDVAGHCDKFRNSLNHTLTFEKVQRMVKNRIQKMIKNKRIKKNWSEEDVLILIWIVSKYADSKDIDNIQKGLDSSDWNQISELIPGVEGENCMFKWLSLKKNNLSDNNWSEKESTLLEKMVKYPFSQLRRYGETDWGLVSQKLYYANTSASKIYRCPKQCREHWNCYLNPKLKKGPWTREQDVLLLNSVLKNGGQKRWAEMVKQFNGRTENALKNRFTLIMEKQVKNYNEGEQKTELKLIEQYLHRSYVDQFVNIISEEQKNIPNNDQKSSKLKEFKKDRTRTRECRASLRRRHSTKTIAEFKTSSKKDYENNSLKIEEELEQPYYHNIYYKPEQQFEKVQIEEEFSEPCHLLPMNLPLFEDDDDDRRFDALTAEDPSLPEIDNVKIIPLDQQMLEKLRKSILSGEGLQQLSNFVPCAIMENKLTKLSF